MAAVRAALLRGGTSKGIFLRAKDIPTSILPATLRNQLVGETWKGGGEALDRFLASALGSPDGSGMQLDGVGAGISSTSKVAIVEQSSRPQCDVDYFFAQVDMRTGLVDWSGSCGNLAAAVGLFSRSEGLLCTPVGKGSHTVRVWQANLGHQIDVTVSGEDAPCNVCVPGVPGLGRAISVKMLNPGGEELLPTGNVRDSVHLPGGRAIDATLLAGANPTVLVRSKDVEPSYFLPPGILTPAGGPSPWRVDAGLLATVDSLREQGARLMRRPLSDALRVAFLAAPAPYMASDGGCIAGSDAELLATISTPGRIHHAFTGTGAANVAAAACIPGTLVHELLPPTRGGDASEKRGARVTLAHPGGLMTVAAECARSADGWVLLSAEFVRTARFLFRGELPVA